MLNDPALKGPMPPAAMLRFLRSSTMPVRRDWNAMGPKLPAWFRLALRRVDKKLVLQFVPPSSHAKGGCDSTQNPFGVWAICRRMRGTGWLAKRWVYNLSDANGMPMPPTRDLIELLIHHRNMCRHGHLDKMERMFDRAMNQKMANQVQQSKDRSSQRIEDRMRKTNMRSHMSPRIVVPSGFPAG